MTAGRFLVRVSVGVFLSGVSIFYQHFCGLVSPNSANICLCAFAYVYVVH